MHVFSIIYSNLTGTNYTAACQGSCGCNDVMFDPVCGTDNKVYFSPCHAGCMDMTAPGPMAVSEKKSENKKHSENADTSTSVTFDM